jgi:hypothetical protein
MWISHLVITLLDFLNTFIKNIVYDNPLTDTNFHVTVIVFTSNCMSKVKGWEPVTSHYRSEDGTEEDPKHITLLE